MNKDLSVTLSEYQFEDIFVGQEYTFTVPISAEMIHTYAELTGDHNPLHVNEVYAQNTEFKGSVAHGFLCSSFFSRLIGMHLPGKNALYLSQDLKFHAPIRPEMNITIKGTVVQKIDAVRALKIKTEICDAKNDATLIDGFAMVKVRS